jgi:hypothetical protein
LISRFPSAQTCRTWKKKVKATVVAGVTTVEAAQATVGEAKVGTRDNVLMTVGGLQKEITAAAEGSGRAATLDGD